MIGIVTAPTTQLKWYQKPFSFSWLIKIFESQDRPKNITFEESPTHTWVLGGKYVNKQMVYEASLQNRIWDYYTPKWEFRFNGITPEQELEVCESLRKDFGSNAYGFGQLLFFVRRKFWSWFGRDMRNSGNWFVERQICTEIAYNALRREGLKANINTSYMDSWNANNCHPLDILNICQYFHNNLVGVLKKNY